MKQLHLRRAEILCAATATVLALLIGFAPVQLAGRMLVGHAVDAGTGASLVGPS